MTFAQYEESRTLGVPTELYTFTSASSVLYYTDSEDDYTYEGNTYVAVPISRTAITSSGSLDKATVTISIAEASPLAAILRRYPASNQVAVTIRQGQRLDPDAEFLVAWTGRVLSSKGGASDRALTCQPSSTAIKRAGLRRNWQYGCPHVLYGDRCRAWQAHATTTLSVTAAGSNSITTPTAMDTHYQGGLLTFGNEVRTILNVTGTTIILGGPVPFSGSQTVDLALGCDHQIDDCQTLHLPDPAFEADYGGGNVHNYGGQPFIPTTNPVGFVSNYG